MLFFTFYLNQINVLGYSIPTMPVIYAIGICSFILILFWEIKRTKLPFPICAMAFLTYYVSENILNRIFSFASRIFLHHDLIQRILPFSFYLKIGRTYFISMIIVVLAPFIATYFYNSRKHYARYLDIFLSGYIAFIFFIRVSDFFVNLHPGKETDLPWGFFYYEAVRHEPSLYEAISLLILFIIVWLVRKKIITPGLLSLFILSWLTLSRFLTDFFRTAENLPNAEFHFSNGVSLNQIAYAIAFPICFFLLLKYLKKEKIGKDVSQQIE